MIPRFSALLLAASCLTAFGQSEYCLDGTVWDEALQGCVVDGQVDGCSLVYDGNNDGLVGSFDLIGFLTEFGAECSPEPTFSCGCLLYTSPSPRDRQKSRMPSSA